MSLMNSYQTKEKDLKKKMRRLKIFEKDIKETFVKSSGPGGQNVNKVSTRVTLQHLPTGIQVKCQKTRQQGYNRYHARCQLVLEIERLAKSRSQEAVRQREKVKRQNRKRPASLKEEILLDKRKQSGKKEARKKIISIDFE